MHVKDKKGPEGLFFRTKEEHTYLIFCTMSMSFLYKMEVNEYGKYTKTWRKLFSTCC